MDREPSTESMSVAHVWKCKTKPQTGAFSPAYFKVLNQPWELNTFYHRPRLACPKDQKVKGSAFGALTRFLSCHQWYSQTPKSPRFSLGMKPKGKKPETPSVLSRANRTKETNSSELTEGLSPDEFAEASSGFPWESTGCPAPE